MPVNQDIDKEPLTHDAESNHRQFKMRTRLRRSGNSTPSIITTITYNINHQLLLTRRNSIRTSMYSSTPTRLVIRVSRAVEADFSACTLSSHLQLYPAVN